MIQVADNIWVGDSDDSLSLEECPEKIGAILNVACDLRPDRRHPVSLEYAQVGLMDGPGNEVADYCAAVLTLKGLVRRNESVLVYDHDGCRALVVSLMYLNLVRGEVRPDLQSTFLSVWFTWEKCYEPVRSEVGGLVVHQAHVAAFNKMPWGLIGVL